MITYEDLKIKINKSGWPQASIETLNSILPSLGQQSLNYMYTNFDELGAPNSTIVPQILKQFPVWRAEIEKGQSTHLPVALASVLERGNRVYKELMSSFVFDIHLNKVLAGRLNPDDDFRLFLYQFANLEEVSSKEVIGALKNYAVDLAKIMDLEAEIKRFCYYKNYTAESPEMGRFRSALEECEQILTDKQITIGEQNFAGTVKNFIKDFKEFSVSLPPRSSSFGVANYVTGAAAMKLLDKEGITILQRILQVYAWLLEGIIAEQEISIYENEREELLQALPDLIAGTVIKPKPQVTPLQPQQPNRFPPQVTALPNQMKIDSIEASQSNPSLQTNSVTKPPVAPVAGLRNQPTEITNPARIRELINHQSEQIKRGVVRDNTNIKISEEQKRIQKEQEQKVRQIQQKLAELRARNKSGE